MFKAELIRREPECDQVFDLYLDCVEETISAKQEGLDLKEYIDRENETLSWLIDSVAPKYQAYQEAQRLNFGDQSVKSKIKCWRNTLTKMTLDIVREKSFFAEILCLAVSERLNSSDFIFDELACEITNATKQKAKDLFSRGDLSREEAEEEISGEVSHIVINFIMKTRFCENLVSSGRFSHGDVYVQVMKNLDLNNECTNFYNAYYTVFKKRRKHGTKKSSKQLEAEKSIVRISLDQPELQESLEFEMGLTSFDQDFERHKRDEVGLEAISYVMQTFGKANIVHAAKSLEEVNSGTRDGRRASAVKRREEFIDMMKSSNPELLKKIEYYYEA